MAFEYRDLRVPKGSWVSDGRSLSPWDDETSARLARSVMLTAQGAEGARALVSKIHGSLRPDEVALIADWRGRPIEVVQTKSGVTIAVDYADNLILGSARPWPPPPVVQKLYESRHSARFSEPTRRAVTRRLGFYSDLQSLHSEDAITWSFFGTLAAAGEERRTGFLNWLMTRCRLPWTSNQRCSIDLWRRVAHPEKRIPGGPELDFVLHGDDCVVFGEVKWLSPEGRGQGKDKNRTQMELRRDFLRDYGEQIYGPRNFVVLGVTLDESLEMTPPAPDRVVATHEVRWDDLAEFADHPHAEEFGAHYRWKRMLIARSRRSEVR